MATNRDGTHRVTFSNLIDSRTGETLRLEVPDTLRYEGGMLYAGFLGQQEGDKIKKLLTKKD